MFKPRTFEPILAVGFDFDGTLADSKSNAPIILEVLARANGCEHRIPLIPKVIQKYWRIGGSPMVAKLLDVPKKRAKEIYPQWAQLEDEYPPPLIEGGIETLDVLASHGIHCGALSARGKSALNRALKRAGLSSRFIHTVSRDCGQHLKPDPRFFSDWLALLHRHHGIEPTNVSYVGDTEDDVIGALASHQVAIAVETGEHHTLEGLHPHVRLASIKEVGLWIVEHNQQFSRRRRPRAQ